MEGFFVTFKRMKKLLQLNCFLLTSLPDNLGNHKRLETEAERAAIQQALIPAEQAGKIHLEIPNDGRFETFKQTLKIYRPHIVYLSGHGEFQVEHHNQKAWGSFLFEDEWGNAEYIDEQTLADCFINIPVQLVVLSACKSAKQHPNYPNNGLAQCLHQAGIPHVIGMRETLIDQAGIQFASAFLSALTHPKHPLPVDQALQKARAAIAQPVMADKIRYFSSNPQRQRIATTQWHLPVLLSHQPNQLLIDTTPATIPEQHKTPVPQIINDIEFPERFIGRRRELRHWQNALRRDEIRQLLIIGAGGMGKTALAGKLLTSLQRDGHTIYAVSIRIDHDWQYTQNKLQVLLTDPYCVENYQNTLSEIDEETPRDNTDIQRIEALLNALLEQHGQFVLLIDNLETYQDSQSKQITDPDTQNWLQAARNTTKHGLKLLTTSRYQLPDWPEHNIEKIGKPIYTDYLAFLRQLKLPARFMVNTERQQTAYEKLGGNFRALHYFALATEGMTLIQEQQFLSVLAEVTHDIQINLALKELISQCSLPQQELLALMRVYPHPVNLSGVRRITPTTMAVEAHIEHLLAVSLLERYWNTDTNEYEYVLSPLIANWLNKNNAAQTDNSLKQTAALYFLEQLESRTKDSWPHILNTIQLLNDSELIPQAHRLILDWVVETLINAAQYQELLRYWLPPLLQSKDKQVIGDALNQIGRVKSHVGDFDSAIETLKQAMAHTIDDDPETYGSALNNLANIQLDQGDYEEAISNLEQSLHFARQDEDTMGEIITLNNLGQAYALTGDYEDASGYLEAAFVLADDLDDDEARGYILNNLAEGYRLTGQFDKSLQYAKESLQIAQAMEDKSAINITLNNISLIYSHRGDYELALEYLFKVLTVDRETSDIYGEAITLNNIGDNYRNLRRYDEALEAFEQALRIRKEVGDQSGQALTMNNIALIHHEWTEDQTTALELLQTALQIQRKIRDRQEESTTLHNISQIYEVRSDYDTALAYLNEALAIQNELGDAVGACHTLFNIAHLYYFRYDSKEEALQIWAEVHEQATEMGLQQVIDDVEDTYVQISLNND